jgi:4-amino-4-deoxy-L-arabinose transferase-like glycosyltransferase
MSATPHAAVGSSPARRIPRARAGIGTLVRARPEVLALIVLSGSLNLWDLSRNGWANTYYAAAVRSMSTSWHNFLFASLDPSGVMTVDKPPLALWVEALSVRVFGYHSLSILAPEALMGVASVVLLYDLVRRRFGRLGGFAAGLALAVTPITVAISRHNNPDALLVLCCVAALWCTVRALEDGRTRWLVAAGVAVGLGFETKMGVALVVVPGIVLAWLLIAPAGRGRLHAMRQLLAGGAAMVLVGGAWPLLVELTPAADRPWISGTSDNRILSLIFEYNGVGRVAGQSGGPGGFGGGSVFGGTPGPLRLLNSALGGQAGWLLGFALVSGVGILLATRLRRSDPRTGWLLVVGGALLTTGVLFSVASGIFHPYYVSLLAPFIAAFAGAGLVHMTRGGLSARILAPLAIIAGVVTELIVVGDYEGQLTWLAPVLITVGVLASVALIVFTTPRVRLIAGGVALAGLLLAPSVWAVDTLGYATSSTFPAGGPASAESGGGGGPFGGFGGSAGRRGTRGLTPGGAGAPLFGNGSSTAGGAGQPSNEGFAGAQAGGFTPGTGNGPGTGTGGPPAAGAGAFGGGGGFGGAGGAFGGGRAFGGGGGAFGGDGSIDDVLAYVKSHGGGTIAVSSQSSAAEAIIASDADVAGIGGFSGRESDVSLSWLAQEVRSGKIRWVLVESTGAGGGGGAGGAGGGGGGVPGEDRPGSKAAMAAVARACERVTVTASSSATGTGAGGSSALGGASLYDCKGRAAAID